MKFSVMSDLHFEFGPMELPDPLDVDVLILAGDILVAEHLERSVNSPYQKKVEVYDQFFNWAISNHKKVIMVCGNHEHYRGDILKSANLIRNRYGVTLLDDDFIDYEGVRIFGSTLWTDFDSGNPITMMEAQWKMNDFDIIRMGHRKFLPQDALARHKRAMNLLRSCNPDVVVSHHAPSFSSVAEAYIGDSLNGAYCTNINLEEIGAKLWFHGHVHDSFDYIQWGTRVVCNPRGYVGHQLNPKFDTGKIICL